VSIDPVCGMNVKEDGAPMSEYQGKNYYFCGDGCKKSFDAEPENYLNEAGKHSHGHGDHGHHCC